MLSTVGLPNTAAGVASLYRELAGRFVLDAPDADQVDAVTTGDLVGAVLGVHR